MSPATLFSEIFWRDVAEELPDDANAQFLRAELEQIKEGGE